MTGRQRRGRGEPMMVFSSVHVRMGQREMDAYIGTNQSIHALSRGGYNCSDNSCRARSKDKVPSSKLV